MNRGPPPEREPADEHDYLVILRIEGGGTCYGDRAILTPVGKRIGKALKFRIHIPVGDGRYMKRELSGCDV